ncbi:LytR/AlgR family response regulator transcription factor [Flavihumibacter petaseus]|nr:LytTR family DNA-binding domain-containing protein [Flavihumibacter petaseus]
MDNLNLLLPGPTGHDFVPVSAVQYIQSNKKQCLVVTTSGEYTVYKSMRLIASQLPEDQFVRIHKRYIVSLRHVITLGKAGLFICGKNLPLSRWGRSELKRLSITFRKSRDIVSPGQ